MKKLLILIFVLSLIASAHGQRLNYHNKSSNELGVFYGTSYYIGDVVPQQHFGSEMNPSGGLLFRKNFTERWSLKANLFITNLEAYDSDSDDPYLVNRNLNFKTLIIDGGIQAELNFLPFVIGERMTPATPYIFAGISVFQMNPKTEYEGVWYELQPLGTEGQGTSEGGDPYNLTNLAIPMGLGIKVNTFGRVTIGVEWSLRKTFTDYIDDISGAYVSGAVLGQEKGQLSRLLADRSLENEGNDSQIEGTFRGNPNTKDWYSFAGFYISFNISKKASSCATWR